MSGPIVSSADRLSMTLFLAAVVHALVILGVGFSTPAPKAAKVPPLIEVTLAERPTADTPEDYDYLAQANQDGGGESPKKQRPKQAADAAAIGAPDGLAPAQTAPPPAPASERSRPVVSATGEQAPTPQPAEAAPAPQPPMAAELVSHNQQTARASALQREVEEVLAKYPSKRRLDARTKAHAAAEYMRRWVEKVEQVGNLNYPEEARRRGLSGSLILEVTIKPDGSVVGVRVLRSSRQPVLDQAAMRVVRIAAPFDPVSPEVLAGNDLLVITRTWEFVDKQGLTTGD